ncbi:hypothetical protein Hdeb2414_s0010g00348811 [Helianthus debilis subsp. tardiflorus]
MFGLFNPHYFISIFYLGNMTKPQFDAFVYNRVIIIFFYKKNQVVGDITKASTLLFQGS